MLVSCAGKSRPGIDPADLRKVIDAKRRGEENLRTSGLGYSIIRPGAAWGLAGWVTGAGRVGDGGGGLGVEGCGGVGKGGFVIRRPGRGGRRNEGWRLVFGSQASGLRRWLGL